MDTDANACDCLTVEDSRIPHWSHCNAVLNGPVDPATTDNDDIRELAELAAYKDIDTAVAILRRHRATKH
ncbi:hypothetical protein SEA_GRAVAILLIA_4 [Mycobacterium phage Gravaillia]|nr:hypothetical protein SEA_GRAVAILLIA_4 [Mycobacterium phage Gravaillia]